MDHGPCRRFAIAGAIFLYRAGYVRTTFTRNRTQQCNQRNRLGGRGRHCHSLTCDRVLSACGFRLSEFIEPLFEYGHLNTDVFIQRAAERLAPILVYILVTASIGGGLGGLVARGIMAGPLRFLATHKWIYDVIDANRKGGVITAYVMTTISQDNKILMYRGRLQEFFLSQDGKLSYVVLKNCARYYMNFEEKFPLTSEQLNLFGSKQDGRPKTMWDYLVIEGTNIANVLFDPSPEIKQTKEGEQALEDEIKKITETIRIQAAQELENAQNRAKAARKV
jgi:hypothetical protein